MNKIFRCLRCDTYTLKETCSCGSKTTNPKSARFKSGDDYSKYRRAYKNALDI